MWKVGRGPFINEILALLLIRKHTSFKGLRVYFWFYQYRLTLSNSYLPLIYPPVEKFSGAF